MPGVEIMIAYQRWHTSSKRSLAPDQSRITSRNIWESISTGMKWAFPGGSNGCTKPEEVEDINRQSMRGFRDYVRLGREDSGAGSTQPVLI